MTIARQAGETVVFILPVTTQPPLVGRHAVDVPQMESQRVGLETHLRKWIMLDGINTHIVE